MRIDIIRQQLSVTAILVVMLLVLCWSRGAIRPLPAEQLTVPTGPVGTWIDTRIAPLDGVRIGLCCLLLFLGAFVVTRVVTRNMVLVVRTYLPALFLIIVGCGFFLPAASLSVVLAAYLMIRGSELMIAGFQRKPTFDRFFRAGLLLGSAPLLYAPALIALPVLIGGLAFFRRGWRESTVGIVAFALPTAVYCYIAWLCGLPADIPLWQIAGAITTPSGFCILTEAGIPRLTVMGLLAVLTILSLGAFTRFAKQTRTRARRVFSYFIWVLFLCAGCFFLPCANPADWMILAVPMAVVAPNYFVRQTGAVPVLIYLLLLAGVAALNLAPLIV